MAPTSVISRRRTLILLLTSPLPLCGAETVVSTLALEDLAGICSSFFMNSFILWMQTLEWSRLVPELIGALKQLGLPLEGIKHPPMEPGGPPEAFRHG